MLHQEPNIDVVFLVGQGVRIIEGVSVRWFLWIIAGCVAAHVQAEPMLDRCHLSLPDSPSVVKAECFHLDVPENWQDPERNTSLTLQAARLAAKSGARDATPVFVLAGGPGASAIDMLIQQPGIFAEINKRHDLVFVDQRGTGRSNALRCTVPTMVGNNDAVAQFVALSRACKEQLVSSPKWYTTAAAVQDLFAVKSALGYEQIHLLGFSYGTRVAQTFIRRYPEAVKSVILDGAVYPGDALGLAHARYLDNLIQQLIDDCAADSPCAERFPRLAQAYKAYVAIEPTTSQELLLTNAATGQRERHLISRSDLDSALRLLSYGAESQALLPLLLTQGAEGDWQALAQLAQSMTARFDALMALGMHHTVMCAEDVRFYPPAETITPSDTQLMMAKMPEALRQICADWPVPPPEPLDRQPLSSDIPALILSGSRDPVTPPADGERVRAQFINGVHLIGKGVGHGVMTIPCFAQLAAEFLTTGAAPEASEDCVDTNWRRPPFLSTLGPAL
jgi:pimeloyl-ACP methyl ester carboxylesterase